MKKNSLKIGIITNEISEDLEYALGVIKKMDLKYIELTNLWGKEIGDLSTNEISKLKDLIDKYELKVSCLAGWNFLGLPLWIKKDDRTYDLLSGWGSYTEHLERLKRTIKIAHILNVNILRVFSFKTEVILNDEIWDKLIEKYQEPIQIAENENITLAIECCPFCNMSTGYLIHKLIERIGSNNLKILWDPANSFYAMGENPFPLEYQYIKNNIIHIHLKDFIMNKRMNIFDCVPAGQGIMSTLDLLKELIKDNYQGVISLEPEFTPKEGTLEEGTLQFFDNLKKMLHKLGQKC